MRTYLSPIGYDTRRVTRPVINTGLGRDDIVVLLRPSTESDTERAEQAVTEVKQLLQEIEPEATCTVTRIATSSFQDAVQECCRVLADVGADREVIVSLGGGARDVLLPLTVSALVFARRIDRALFFSDLDGTVREWPLPRLTAQVPERTIDTFETVADADGWLSLTAIAAETDQSKSTVIRHVNDLEDAGVVASDTSQKAKRVQVTLSGELFLRAQAVES